MLRCKCYKWQNLLKEENNFLVYFVKKQSHNSRHNSYLECLGRFVSRITLRPGERLLKHFKEFLKKATFLALLMCYVTFKMYNETCNISEKG